MTAGTRRRAAAPAVPTIPESFAAPPIAAELLANTRAFTAPESRCLKTAVEHWRRAIDIRREWLGWGLSTEPADRPAAQDALAAIYARVGRPRPRFEWVESPYQALPLVAGLPGLDVLFGWVTNPCLRGSPPLASDLAAALSRLRGELDERVTRPDFDPPAPKRRRAAGHKAAPQPWPVLPPVDALCAGIPFREVLRQGVREALRVGLAEGFYLPVRAALAAGRPLPVAWYGQQEAYWIGYYDTWRRLGLAQYGNADDEHLDAWATLARSCGWWWPGEDVCVVVERPAVIRVEQVPGAYHDEVRPRRTGGPAVEYRDGWRPDLLI